MACASDIDQKLVTNQGLMQPLWSCPVVAPTVAVQTGLIHEVHHFLATNLHFFATTRLIQTLHGG